MLRTRLLFDRSAGFIGLIGAVGGFISDVLQPLGDFSPWLTGISLAVTVAAAIWLYIERRKPGVDIIETRAAVTLFIAGTSTIVFALLTAFMASAPPNGYLAESVPAIADLQRQLLNLEEQVAELQETAEQTAEDITQLITTTGELSENVAGVISTTAELGDDVAGVISTTDVISAAVAAVLSDTTALAGDVSAVVSTTGAISETVGDVLDTTAAISESVATVISATTETAANVETVISTTEVISAGVSTLLSATEQTAAGVSTLLTTTAALAGEVDALQDTAEETAASVEEIAQPQAAGFAELQASFAQLIGSQTLVADPQTPQEWYSNARIYQLKGDTANAIKAYEGYLQFKLEYVDPLLEYTQILKATDGIARTRQAVNALLDANPASFTLDLIAATLLDTPAEQSVRLEALAERAPLFGPVFNELGKVYDAVGVNGGTRALLLSAAENYAKVVELEKEQNFSRYFIDKVRATNEVDAAAARLPQLQNSVETMKPSVLINQQPEGVVFAFILYDAAELFISIDDPAALKSTGFINSIVGPLPNTNNLPPLPVEPGDHVLYWQYRDKVGFTSALYEEPFSLGEIAVVYYPQPADFATGKIKGFFQAGLLRQDGKEYTYYYSLDSEALDQTPPGGPVIADGSQVFIQFDDLAAGDHILYVQAEDTAGERSGITQFKFTVTQ
jgi:archaellum component FlaC